MDGLFRVGQSLTNALEGAFGVSWELLVIGSVLCFVALFVPKAMAAGVGNVHLPRWRKRRIGQRGGGFATWWQLRALRSGRARREAYRLRPSISRSRRWQQRREATAEAAQCARAWVREDRCSLRGVRAWARSPARVWSSCSEFASVWFPPLMSECGVLIGRHRWLTRLYATFRDTLLIIAPPQTCKTAWMANLIIDAPGAVLSTSTKVDMIGHTRGFRDDRGPIWVFNPKCLGGIESSFAWDFVQGCEVPEVAISRARYLLNGSDSTKGMQEKAFFKGTNMKVLRCLLYAAGVAGLTGKDVHAWVVNYEDETPLQILTEFGRRPDWVGELTQIYQSNEQTRSNIFVTLSLTFEFMADERVVESVCPDSDRPLFDPRELIESNGTLYLVADDKESGGLNPVFTALTGLIFETAAKMAAASAGEKLDPPLTLALDEAALICSVPLDKWMADSAGRGIIIAVAAQALSQLRTRWGTEGADSIWACANAKLIAPGMSSEADLTQISKLCAERTSASRSVTVGHDRKKSRTSDKEGRSAALLSVSQIRTLPDWSALLVYRNLPPTIVRIIPVWKRDKVRYRRHCARLIRRRDWLMGAWVAILGRRSHAGRLDLAAARLTEEECVVLLAGMRDVAEHSGTRDQSRVEPAGSTGERWPFGGLEEHAREQTERARAPLACVPGHPFFGGREPESVRESDSAEPGDGTRAEG